MKRGFVPITMTLALLSLSAETAAASDGRIRAVTVEDRPWSEKQASATACNPNTHVAVERFYAKPSIQSGTFDVEVLVDGEVYGIERLTILQPLEASAERVELLRFYPRQRLRLLDLVAEGALVEIRSEGLGEGALPLSRVIGIHDDSADASRVDFISESTITRSTWRRGSSDDTDQSDLRHIFAAETFAECMNNCQWVEEDCISYWNCHWADQQCLGHCEQEEDDCEDDCPCTGVDPVLVDEYTVVTEVAVSARLAVICAGNIFSPYNKTYYDRYSFVERTKTYRVWEDCHGDQTTELVSTVDSAPYTCHVYTGQICGQTGGVPPVCVID